MCFITKRPEVNISKEKITFKGLLKSFSINVSEIQDVRYFTFMNSDYIYFVGRKKAFSMEYLDTQHSELSKIIKEVSDQRLTPKFETEEMTLIQKITLALR